MVCPLLEGKKLLNLSLTWPIASLLRNLGLLLFNSTKSLLSLLFLRICGCGCSWGGLPKPGKPFSPFVGNSRWRSRRGYSKSFLSLLLLFLLKFWYFNTKPFSPFNLFLPLLMGERDFSVSTSSAVTCAVVSCFSEPFEVPNFCFRNSFFCASSNWVPKRSCLAFFLSSGLNTGKDGFSVCQWVIRVTSYLQVAHFLRVRCLSPPWRCAFYHVFFCSHGFMDTKDSNPFKDIAAAEPQSSKKKAGSFQALGLIPPVLKGVLNKGYKVPTPIQRKSIPPALAGEDIIAMVCKPRYYSNFLERRVQVLVRPLLFWFLFLISWRVTRRRWVDLGNSFLTLRLVPVLSFSALPESSPNKPFSFVMLWESIPIFALVCWWAEILWKNNFRSCPRTRISSSPLLVVWGICLLRWINLLLRVYNFSFLMKATDCSRWVSKMILWRFCLR